MKLEAEEKRREHFCIKDIFIVDSVSFFSHILLFFCPLPLFSFPVKCVLFFIRSSCEFRSRREIHFAWQQREEDGFKIWEPCCVQSKLGAVCYEHEITYLRILTQGEETFPLILENERNCSRVFFHCNILRVKEIVTLKNYLLHCNKIFIEFR